MRPPKIWGWPNGPFLVVTALTGHWVSGKQCGSHYTNTGDNVASAHTPWLILCISLTFPWLLIAYKKIIHPSPQRDRSNPRGGWNTMQQTIMVSTSVIISKRGVRGFEKTPWNYELSWAGEGLRFPLWWIISGITHYFKHIVWRWNEDWLILWVELGL